MNWYIVQAYSGFENKVADSIKDIMAKNSLQNNLGEILVPTQKVVEVKKGKRTQKEKKYFPGYVLVKLDLNKNIYHKIKSIQNPDARVTIVKEYAKKHFPSTPILDFALEVEQVTTKKKNNLILNVDGCIAACFVDMMRNCGAFEKEEVSEM